MTAGDNGSKPEDDDPFGYLYADGQASGATPPSGGGYGYPGPRSSYHQVRPVGERQYGGPPQGHAQQPTAAYGQVPPQQGYGQPPYGQPGQVQAPGGPGAHGAPGGQGGGRGRGPNTKGILIGAVAVVAAVVIGIVVVVVNGDDDKEPAASDKTATAPAQGPDGGDEGDKDDKDDEKAEEEPEEPGELPRLDAKALKLEGGTSTASDVEGAKAAGGVYVTGFDKVGAAVTWTIDDLPDPGKYTVFVGYGVPGKDANATLTVNGTAQTRPFSLKNFARAAEGDLEKGWTQSFGYIDLNKGTNTIKLSCEDGNDCDVNLDRFWLKKGWVSE
ncbi:carbohydrate-binding protein [Streptomyces sp. JNUCC 64]